MAKQTAKALVTQADAAETHKLFHVTKQIIVDSSHEAYYVVGLGNLYAGRSRWIVVDTTRTLAQQASDILAGLIA